MFYYGSTVSANVDLLLIYSQEGPEREEEVSVPSVIHDFVCDACATLSAVLPDVVGLFGLIPGSSGDTSVPGVCDACSGSVRNGISTVPAAPGGPNSVVSAASGDVLGVSKDISCTTCSGISTIAASISTTAMHCPTCTGSSTALVLTSSDTMPCSTCTGTSIVLASASLVSTPCLTCTGSSGALELTLLSNTPQGPSGFPTSNATVAN